MTSSFALTLAGYFGSWLAAISGVWTLFEKAESAANPEAKRKLADWVTGSSAEKALSGMIGLFGNAFDAVFGTRLLSWKLFYRSALASLAWYVVLVLAWFGLHTREVSYSPNHAGLNWLSVKGLFVYWLILNLVPDYLSVLQTRWWISFVAKRQSWRSSSIALIASALISSALGFLSFFALRTYMIATTPGWHDVFAARKFLVLDMVLFLSIFDILAVTWVVPLWIWLATTLMTSVWLWLYIIASVLARAAHSIDWVKKAALRFVDAREKPFTALATILVTLITAGYLAGAVLLLVTHIA